MACLVSADLSWTWLCKCQDDAIWHLWTFKDRRQEGRREADGWHCWDCQVDLSIVCNLHARWTWCTSSSYYTRPNWSYWTRPKVSYFQLTHVQLLILPFELCHSASIPSILCYSWFIATERILNCSNCAIMPSTVSLSMRSVSGKHSIRAFVSESESERIYHFKNHIRVSRSKFWRVLSWADILRTEWDGH